MAKKNKPYIYPDEIFMDSENVSGFDTQQFEGRIEKPIEKKTFLAVGIFFVLIAVIFFGRVFSLQILRGSEFSATSENNRLRSSLIFPERGVIYDRNGEELAWNGPSFRIISRNENGNEIILATFYDWEQALNYASENEAVEIESFSSRFYTDKPGLSHILGYLGYPSKEDLESDSPPLREMMIGKEGIERRYEEKLKGEVGSKLIEIDSQANISSESVQKNPVSGDNIHLSIDSEVQSVFFDFLKAVADERDFQGGSGIILDIDSGEILSLVNYPEYDSSVLSRGAPADKIKEFIYDKKKPFLNRAVSGLYAPGSIVKPFVAIAALNEGTVSPEKSIFSSGSISLPNPYFPDKRSVFYDWKAHGWVDMRKALAVSSDVYFYEIGGGFEDVKGLGIKKIMEYAEKFGLGKKTGIDLYSEKEGLVPGPEWKATSNVGDSIWRVGDTYNASIGQGSFQVTPIQMAVFAAAFANNGKIVQPRLNRQPLSVASATTVVNITEKYFFQIIKEGMRMAVTEGTAMALNIHGMKIAAKTGTAQVGISKRRVNSWIIGFFPYENPKFAFSIVLERGPAENLVGASSVARNLFEWMNVNTPEYLFAKNQ